MVINFYAALERNSQCFWDPTEGARRYIVFWASDGMAIKPSRQSTGKVLVGAPNNATAQPISPADAVKLSKYTTKTPDSKEQARALYSSFDAFMLLAGDCGHVAAIGFDLSTGKGAATKLGEDLHRLFLKTLGSVCVGCLVRAVRLDPAATLDDAAKLCDLQCSECVQGRAVCARCAGNGHTDFDPVRRTCQECRTNDEVGCTHARAHARAQRHTDTRPPRYASACTCPLVVWTAAASSSL